MKLHQISFLTKNDYSIFPFVPNMFHSSSQWVLINNPIFKMRRSHKMATDMVSIAIKGGRVKKGKKTRGAGKGKTLW
jgi:hypothetical protein